MKFKETKSQERLINLMLQAGVEWPNGATHAMQSGLDGYLLFSDGKPERSPCGWTYQSVATPVSLTKPLPNWHQTIITREQYEARDGWITWHGGECPVACDVVVQATLRHGDISNFGPIKASGFSWVHSGEEDDIIAYRIHKEQPEAEPCESVKACIPDQPTIEQLIAEWKRLDEIAEKSRDIAEKDQEAFDRAAEAVEEALKKAGWQ